MPRRVLESQTTVCTVCGPAGLYGHKSLYLLYLSKHRTSPGRVRSTARTLAITHCDWSTGAMTDVYRTTVPHDAHICDYHREKRRQKYARYRTRHAEQRKARERARYAAHREERRAAAVRYRAAHPGRAREKAAQRRAANPEHVREIQRRWYAKNREKERAREQSRRAARKASAPLRELTEAQWRAIKDHYHHCCVYCGRRMQRLTMDHLTPLSKGGQHTVQNVVPACVSCNSRKQAGPPLKPVQPLLLAL